LRFAPSGPIRPVFSGLLIWTASAQPDDQPHFTGKEKAEKTPMKSTISAVGFGYFGQQWQPLGDGLE
jgi:hypothetical protein